MSISEWRQKLNRGEVSSLELLEEHMSRIKSIDKLLHSYLYINYEKAKALAVSIDESRSAGEELPPLAGVPFAIKDNLCTKGIPVSYTHLRAHET